MFDLQEKVGQRWIVAVTEFGLRRPNPNQQPIVDILITEVRGMRVIGTDPQGQLIQLHARELAFVGQIS